MANRNYVAEGSSSSVTGQYPTQYVALSSVPTTLTDVATAGATLTDYEGRVSSNNALLVPGAVNFMTLWPLGNDLFPGDGNPNSVTNLAILARYQTLCSNYRTAGWRIWIVTPSPTGDAFDAMNGAGAAANLNTVKAAYITTMTGWVGAYIEGIIDWWNDANYGYSQRNDLTKYPTDGVHISATGQTYLANLFLPTLDLILPRPGIRLPGSLQFRVHS